MIDTSRLCIKEYKYLMQLTKRNKVFSPTRRCSVYIRSSTNTKLLLHNDFVQQKNNSLGFLNVLRRVDIRIFVSFEFLAFFEILGVSFLSGFLGGDGGRGHLIGDQLSFLDSSEEKRQPDGNVSVQHSETKRHLNVVLHSDDEHGFVARVDHRWGQIFDVRIFLRMLIK